MPAKELFVHSHLTIPAEDLEIQFSRSSGAGGQNVNKVNSRAELRFNVAQCTALPPGAKTRLMSSQHQRITSEGVLYLSSQRFRDQGRNVDDCYQKLRNLIEDALHVDPDRRPTRPSRGSVERRIAEKKRRSDVKRTRGGGGDEG